MKKFKFAKYSKYSKILLVDCENVGFSLEIIPEDTYVFMFVSKPNKLYYFAPKNMEIVDISQYKKGLIKIANYMDFYMMYFLTKNLKKWRGKEIAIISKDRDFDAVRNILLQENIKVKTFKGNLTLYLNNHLVNNHLVNNHLEIIEGGNKDICEEVLSNINQRNLNSELNIMHENCTTEASHCETEEMHEISGHKVPLWLYNKMSSAARNHVSRYKDMESYIASLKKSEKEVAVYKQRVLPILNNKIFIQYDIYKNLYQVNDENQCIYEGKDISQAEEEYHKQIKSYDVKSQDSTLSQKEIENRLSGSSDKEINNLVIPSWLSKKMTKETKNELSHWTNMKDLRGHLSNGQRKIFIYKHTDIPISQLHIDIYYDIYTQLYEVRNYGHFSYQSPSLEDAMNVYQNHIDTLKAMSKKYKDNTIFKKAKQHAILPYIEISSSTGKPLYDSMCEFMNEDEAYEKYFRFIEDLSI